MGYYNGKKVLSVVKTESVYTIDDKLSNTSENPVQNKEITVAFNESSKKTFNLIKSKNLYNKDKEVLTQGILKEDGSIESANYLTTDFIFLPAGTYVYSPSVKYLYRGRIISLGFSMDKKVDTTVSSYNNTPSISYLSFVMLKDGYIRFSFDFTMIDYRGSGDLYYEPQLEVGTTPTLFEKIYCYGEEVVKLASPTNNLIDLNNIEVGYLYQSGQVNASGTSYRTTEYIQVKANMPYAIKGVARFVWYRSCDGQATLFEQNKTDYQFTPTKDGYLRVTASTTDIESLTVSQSSEVPTTFIPFGYKLNDNVFISENLLNEIKKEVSGGVLNGKKYTACGDSFTDGGYQGNEGIEESYYKYLSGQYAGRQKTYPFILGLRNNMQVVNEAIGGSTLARWEGDSNSTSFARIRYKNIPSDTDYITLKFGINDSHHNIPIGTIDSEDPYTFYGAWNVILSYLIENYPYAKIGIIVSNGCDTADYPNATRNIAKKYGIPYLDEVEGEQVPLLIRSYRTGVPSSIQAIRNEAFRVSETNLHPNVKGQEYESTIVENFLRSL